MSVPPRPSAPPTSSHRGELDRPTANNIVLLVLAGAVVGYASTWPGGASAASREALAVEAATRERERLARDIHDGVLQVLALVQRRGAELGGEAAELGRLAGEQEAALRALVSGSRPMPARRRRSDLRGAARGVRLERR